MVTPLLSLQELLGGGQHREEWDFIRDLAARAPISEGLEEWLDELASLEYCSLNARTRSVALAWAHQFDTSTVSLDGHPDWFGSYVEAERAELSADGDIRASRCRVRNMATSAHVEEHTEWLKSLGFEALPPAATMWEQRGDRFPKLRFLTRTREDLEGLEASGAAYKQAVAALLRLNSDIDAWPARQAWPTFSSKASPEGEVRKALCGAHDERTGSRESFDWHVRFTGGGAGRVHFRIDQTERIAVVAYVGNKLERPFA